MYGLLMSFLGKLDFLWQWAQGRHQHAFGSCCLLPGKVSLIIANSPRHPKPWFTPLKPSENLQTLQVD